MQLKTIRSIQNGKASVCLKDYSEKECRDILTERNAYVLKVEHCQGSDYGGSQCREESRTLYEEIIPERILVRDGHFFGASICVEYGYYNGGENAIYGDAILPADKTLILDTPKARDGFSFSNDDHSRWNYRSYCLIRRDE